MRRCNKCESALNGSHNKDDEKHYKILFIRDKRKCDDCNNEENEDYGCNRCNHTSDVRHAKNFELYGDVFIEK